MSAESVLRGQEARGRDLLLARVLAAVAAVGWAVPFFGLVDLLVVPIQDERFYDAYLLETGWGLLYTVLVTTPLLAFVVWPGSPVLLHQLVAAAAAVAIAAVLTPQWWQLAPAAVLLAIAVLLARLSGQQLWPGRRGSAGRTGRLRSSLVLVAAVGAVAYAASMIRASRAGMPDDVTWGLDHLPMQAAFALALVGSAALAAFSWEPGRRTVGWTAGVSAVWLGAVSVAYPDHLGSLGQPMGIAAIAWGLVFTVSIQRTGRAT